MQYKIFLILKGNITMEFGLNLYTIRTAIQTREDFLNTAFRLKDMGYSFLQFSGGKYDPAVIKEVSQATGLPIVLTHVPMDRILNDTDALMKEHESFGCHNIGLGAMPGNYVADDVETKKGVDMLNVAADYMAKNGFHFFYHHHSMELRKMANGQTVLEYMIDNAPNVNFTVDTFWLQHGGVSVIEYVRKLNGRIECAHLKDYKIGEGFAPRIAACGDGNINFRDVIPALMDSGVKYLLVEQDNAPDMPDPFGELKFSIDYLRSNFGNL